MLLCACAWTLETNEKIQEGRKVGSNACLRACMRGVHADTADHFPWLHFHDWWSGSVSAAIDSVDWSDLRHPVMRTCRGITLSATLGPLNTNASANAATYCLPVGCWLKRSRHTLNIRTETSGINIEQKRHSYYGLVTTVWHFSIIFARYDALLLETQDRRYTSIDRYGFVTIRYFSVIFVAESCAFREHTKSLICIGP